MSIYHFLIIFSSGPTIEPYSALHSERKLLYFIDETISPDEREFSARYFRRPENYPELAERVNPYCFRTLRAQASAYAKIPDRLLLTVEYEPSPEERKLYELLFSYVNKPFPEMDSYDLALHLLGVQSSSAIAIRRTVSGIVRRLEHTPEAEAETAELRGALAACDAVTLDTKARLLLDALERAFTLMKRRGCLKRGQSRQSVSARLSTDILSNP